MRKSAPAIGIRNAPFHLDGESVVEIVALTRTTVKQQKLRDHDMEIIKGANGLYYLALLLTIAAAMEWLTPWKRVAKIDFARWARNGSMSFYCFIILGLVPFVAGYGGAVAVQERGFGLYNQVGAPF